MKYLIGVDLGTTVAKCAIYDEDQIAISEARREMDISYPSPGEAEQNASSFYTITCDLIQRCLKTTKVDPKAVACIAIDSQMGGIMSIDNKFKPVTYYDSPLDSRSAHENRFMHEMFGDLILRNNGAFSTFGNKILYWKKKDEWKQIYKFIQPSAYVSGKLAGISSKDAYIDETFICFSGLAELKQSKWSEELCEKLAVDIEKLPKIVKPIGIIGELTTRASKECGLPAGIPICAGSGDQAAGFIGAGILNQGQMIDVSGTACILGACVNEYTFDIKNKTLACMKSALGDKYYLLSVVLGGRIQKWFVDEFFAEEKSRIEKSGGSIYSYLDEKARLLSPGSDGLIAIDYLQGRFFPPDPTIKGLFIGHTWAHKKIHFYRAILESIAYDHYLTKKIINNLLPELRLNVVTAMGSGAKSAFWMQLKSDIIQTPYQTLMRNEYATLGSAIIAGCAVGLFKDIDAAIKKSSKIKQKINPVPGEDGKYIKYIKIYQHLFNSLKEDYKRLCI